MNFEDSGFLPGHTILMVDDTPANLSVLAQALENFGLRVLVAQDGNEAIQRAGFARPDLILLDILMPELTGLEVMRRIRERTNTPLQALVTLNDPVYLEAAHGLARRMMREGSSVGDRIRSGFEWCLARQPNDKEMNRLSVLFGEALSEYAKSGEKAKQLTSTGDEAGSDVAEFAAWTTVANVLLNLDETLMKR